MATEANPLSVLEKSLGEAAAFAAGLAIGPLLAPYLQELKNATWKGTPTLPLDPADVADWVAEDLGNLTTGEAEAALTGLSATPFSRLVQTRLTAPGTGELLQAIRRQTISEEQFTHGLRKGKFETEWDAALRDLANVKLAPAQIALGIVRTLMDSHGLLIGENVTTGGVIAPTPVSPINPIAEAALSGIDEERLRIMVGEIGLPMSLQQAASAVYRGIIKKPDFYLAVAQGDTRPAWADAIFEQAREILSVGQYVEGHLRGWTNEQAMYANTAKHGMSQADTDLLFKISGRPITIKQITTGLARGGTYPATYDDVPEPYRKSLQESNIRPEWALLDYANRYTYPSGFQVKSEAKSGDLDYENTHQLLLEMGWVPKWAQFFAEKWTGGPAVATDPHLSKAQTQLWTAAHRSYLTGELTDADATSALEAAGVASATVPDVLRLWAHEANIARKALTPAQIKKAYAKAAKNAVTGQPWTQEEALDALIERGYPPTFAQDYLNIP